MVKLEGCYSGWLMMISLSCFITVGVACPDLCTCVERLYIYCDHSNMSDEELPFVFDNIPKETIYIDLSFNNLTFIPESTFKKFSELIYLDLSHNKIENLLENVFRNLKNLQKIFFHHNALTRLRNRTFSELPLLKEVHAYKNNIRAIETCAFIKTPKLDKLLMHNNWLNVITNRTLTSLENLSYIDLSENSIQTVSEKAFLKLVSLQTLILSRNDISSLYPYSFTGLISLKNLDLNENLINNIDGFTFNPFRNTVRTILLRSNKIKSVGSDVFYEMRSLNKVDLSLNEIIELGDRMFLGVSLEELSLHGNHLTEIKTDVFLGAKKIGVLDLSHNNIKAIHIGAFNSLFENIFEINMEYNELRRLLAGMFSGMKFLQAMKMANNSLSYIEDSTFKDLLNLKKLDLSWNELSIVTSDMMYGLLSLQYLNLHSNPLMKFEFPDFLGMHGSIEVNMNLTVRNVSHDTVIIKWPYMSGSQIYWSMMVVCVEAEQCTFTQHSDFLAPYQSELVLKNLQTNSLYYICVNPTFRSDHIKLQQCLHVWTDTFVNETTLPLITVSEESISAASVHATQLILLLCSSICIYTVF